MADRPGDGPLAGNPDLVGFYRWHVADPIMFERDLRVTIQQIGAKAFTVGPGGGAGGLRAPPTRRPAPAGTVNLAPGLLAWGIAERVDDYCATAYLYCRDAQPVARVDPAAAVADIGRLDYETASPFERLGGLVDT